MVCISLWELSFLKRKEHFLDLNCCPVVDTGAEGVSLSGSLVESSDV